MAITLPDTHSKEPPPQRKGSVLDLDAVQRIATAIADPRRYEILQILAESPTGIHCSSVRECVDIAPPTLSHHMKELRAARLISETRSGREVLYKLRRDKLEAFLRFLRADLLPPA